MGIWCDSSSYSWSSSWKQQRAAWSSPGISCSAGSEFKATPVIHLDANVTRTRSSDTTPFCRRWPPCRSRSDSTRRTGRKTKAGRGWAARTPLASAASRGGRRVSWIRPRSLQRRRGTEEHLLQLAPAASAYWYEEFLCCPAGDSVPQLLLFPPASSSRAQPCFYPSPPAEVFPFTESCISVPQLLGANQEID